MGPMRGYWLSTIRRVRSRCGRCSRCDRCVVYIDPCRPVADYLNQ